MRMDPPSPFIDLRNVGRVCRLGLATRGDSNLDAAAVNHAIERGVNYMNWCGRPDGMCDAIRGLGPRRQQVVVAVQLEARRADAAQRELDELLSDLGTDYIDVVTYYYVEHADEWTEIISDGGAAEALESARQQGKVRAIGLTSHQRKLAAQIAESGRLNMLMIRYNAAHRGAEQDVFPVAAERGIPVIAFTCLRWGALLEATPDDPPGFVVPLARDWYRWVLRQPAVAVALMAPNDSRELSENLTLLDDWHSFSPLDYEQKQLHGDRVRRRAPNFP
jgi:predicted aldo/keto reductase-like oxidoreductase